MGDVIPIGATRSTNEIEEQLIGAVLDLPDKLELIDAMNIARENFQSARIGLVWMVIRRLAEHRHEVTATTVVSKGQRYGLLSDSDLGWLIGLAANNTQTKTQALQIAEDIRALARGRTVLAKLEAQADLIRRGRFVPSQVSGALEGIIQNLIADFSPDETADGDEMQIMSGWDAHEKEGTSTLLPTGIRILDEQITGWPAKIAFIAAEAGVGKSALLASIIQAQFENGIIKPDEKIGLFGIEDGTEWLTRRWLAKGSGMQLSDIGWKKRTPQESEAVQATSEKIFPWLQRVVCYRRDTITTDELIRRAAKWVFQDNVKCIYVDHLGEIDHRNPHRREESWQQVDETVRKLRNFAIRYSVPVVVLVHTTGEGTNTRKDGPADLTQLAGGRTVGRKARTLIALWQKNNQLRATFTKATESKAKGTTVEFERIFNAAMVTSDGGSVIDLDAEQRREQAEKRVTKRQESVRESLFRKDALEKAKEDLKKSHPTPPAEPPAQAMLLDVPSTEKPN